MTKVIWKLVYVANVVDTISNRYKPLSYFMEVYMNLSCNFSKKNETHIKSVAFFIEMDLRAITHGMYSQRYKLVTYNFFRFLRFFFRPLTKK